MAERIGVAAIGDGAADIAFGKPRQRDQSRGGFRVEPAAIDAAARRDPGPRARRA